MVDDGFALRYIDKIIAETRQYIDERLASIATAFDRDVIMEELRRFGERLDGMTSAETVAVAAAELAQTAAATAVIAADAAIDAAEDAEESADDDAEEPADDDAEEPATEPEEPKEKPAPQPEEPPRRMTFFERPLFGGNR